MGLSQKRSHGVAVTVQGKQLWEIRERQHRRFAWPPPRASLTTRRLRLAPPVVCSTDTAEGAMPWAESWAAVCAATSARTPSMTTALGCPWNTSVTGTRTANDPGVPLGGGA